MAAHRAYHQALFDAGKVVLGGGVPDNTGGLNVASEAEAVAIAHNDPAVFGDLMSVEVHPLFVVFREKSEALPNLRPFPGPR